jgi:hypothetical protein
MSVFYRAAVELVKRICGLTHQVGAIPKAA